MLGVVILLIIALWAALVVWRCGPPMMAAVARAARWGYAHLPMLPPYGEVVGFVIIGVPFIVFVVLLFCFALSLPHIERLICLFLICRWLLPKPDEGRAYRDLPRLDERPPLPEPDTSYIPPPPPPPDHDAFLADMRAWLRAMEREPALASDR